jgi:hypothetical protein
MTSTVKSYKKRPPLQRFSRYNVAKVEICEIYISYSPMQRYNEDSFGGFKFGK